MLKKEHLFLNISLLERPQCSVTEVWAQKLSCAPQVRLVTLLLVLLAVWQEVLRHKQPDWPGSRSNQWHFGGGERVPEAASQPPTQVYDSPRKGSAAVLISETLSQRWTKPLHTASSQAARPISKCCFELSHARTAFPSSRNKLPLVLTSQLFSPSSSCEPVSTSHVEFTFQPRDTARTFSSSWARLCFQSRNLQLSSGRGFASSHPLPQLITCASTHTETLPQHNPHTKKKKNSDQQCDFSLWRCFLEVHVVPVDGIWHTLLQNEERQGYTQPWQWHRLHTSGTSSSLTKIFCSCLKLNFRVTHGDRIVSSFPHREDGTWGEESSFRVG